jgi:hypothetical protein
MGQNETSTMRRGISEITASNNMSIMDSSMNGGGGTGSYVMIDSNKGTSEIENKEERGFSFGNLKHSLLSKISNIFT